MNVAGKYKLISFENRNKNGFDLIGRESRFGLRTTIGASFLKALYVFAWHKKIGTPVQPFWFTVHWTCKRSHSNQHLV
jgi:hypothetical protein